MITLCWLDSCQFEPVSLCSEYRHSCHIYVIDWLKQKMTEVFWSFCVIYVGIQCLKCIFFLIISFFICNFSAILAPSRLNPGLRTEGDSDSGGNYHVFESQN